MCSWMAGAQVIAKLENEYVAAVGIAAILEVKVINVYRSHMPL